MYINQQRILADVTFPSPPTVVSLLDYDDTANAAVNPTNGYPVICVTVSYTRSADVGVGSSFLFYSLATRSISSTRKSRQFVQVKESTIKQPSSDGLLLLPVAETTSQILSVKWHRTLFSQTPGVSPSIVSTSNLAAESHVWQELSLLMATLVWNQNLIQLQVLHFILMSRFRRITQFLLVRTDKGLCPPRVVGAVGAEPFSAKIRYTGPTDPDYPNLIKLTVSMPHIDGMLPVISTREPSNFEITLSKDGSRAGNHRYYLVFVCTV